MKYIVITGSYNGQDSLGDECLLKCVVQRVRKILPESDIVVQLHNVETPFIQNFSKVQGVCAKRGVQSFMWRVGGIMGRAQVPEQLSSWILSEFALEVGRLVRAKSAIDPVKDLRKADLFIVFGGTQFSGQWYHLNAPAYIKSAEIVKKSGGRVVFGPQQYGPFLNSIIRGELKSLLDDLVDIWCTRNRLDVEELGGGEDVYDEVFSNKVIYPSRTPGEPEYILVNVRNLTFDTNDDIARLSFRRLAALLDRLIAYYKLPVLFFAVSDDTFCDDVGACEKLKQFMERSGEVKSIGRVRDENKLIELARSSKITISMSFHGCLLAGIGGSPFVPITEGRYYDYKYADFDKYTGEQGVPLIELSKCDPDRDADRIVEFVGKYDFQRLHLARDDASRILDDFYERALSLRCV